MTWKLFIDDERFPVKESEWFIARNYEEATWEVSQMGMPQYISFDHDLGTGPTGSDFVDWLIDYMLDEGLKFPKGFEYYVHSQNPIGANNIRGKMDGAVKFFGYEE